ncbi:TPA: hypothetical protein KMB30_004195 [Escherichia coli]|nr:hypothetical protein [Escherichia coli]
MLNSLTLFKAYVFQDGGYRLFCTIRKNDVVTFLSKPAHPGDLLFRRGFTIWFFKLNSHAVINTACFIETHVRIAELRWVVTLAAGLEDESQGMTVGKKLKLPPATWIREMIRHFQYDGQVIGTLSIA